MFCNYDLFLSYIMSFVRIVALAFGGYFLIGIVVARVRRKFIHGRFDDLCIELISHIISYILFFGISLAIFHELGINITAFLGIAGIVGIAVGYAAQSSISNLISGLFLMFERPFKIGDELIVNSIKGHVVDVNLFALVLRDATNTLITIPHDQYRKSPISNLRALPMKRYDFCIEVQHVSSIDRLQKILEQVVHEHTLPVPEKTTYLEITQLYAYTITVALGVWSAPEKSLQLKGRLLVEIERRLQQEGFALTGFFLGHDKGIL